MKDGKMKFSDYFFQKRIKLGYTLRQFCKTKGLDPAYISRIENNIILPPQNPDKAKALAIALEIERNSTEWIKFFDLLAASHKTFPEDIKNDPKMIHLLPTFYRTLRREKINQEDIEELRKIIKDGHGDKQ